MEVLLEGAAASRLLRLPHVLHYRGNTIDEPRVVFDALVRLWTATAERIFCISDATAGVFRRRGRGAKVEVHYNPVDLSAFLQARRDETVRRELGAGPGDVLLGTVGRIHPRKDVATFLRAVALLVPALPQVRAVVVGDAEGAEERAYRARMLALADELGIAGHLCWAGTRRDMPSVLKALDVFVLSSRHEGFGRVVAEAMAAATPTVLSDEGALPELAAQGSRGRLARPADPSDFALKIESLVRDPAAREQLGAMGQAAVARFDAQALAATVYVTYSKLVTSGRRPKASPAVEPRPGVRP